MSNESLLTIRNLRVRFKTFEGMVRAVDGVDLDVAMGEAVGLVGESGCGKSVTALSILRLLPARSTEIEGSILFKDKNLLELRKEEILNIRGDSISMIFQEPMTSLNPVLAIGDQIAEAFVLHRGLTWGEARKKAVEMLETVQIPEPETQASNFPHSLSGGMRQRAMIAMALSCQPQLLLADEPTTALDVTIQAQIMDLMQRLKNSLNAAILLITHDLGLIAEMTSRVVVMYAGQVVEAGPIKALFREPLHPYTKGLLNCIPVLGRKFETGRRKLEEIPGVVPSPLGMPEGCRFNLRCPVVKEICREKKPPMVHPDEKRRVLCWLRA